MQKELNSIKQENVYLKDQVEINKNNYEKVLLAYKKCKKNEFSSVKLPESPEDQSQNTPRTNLENMRKEIETGFSNIRSQQRRSHIIEDFKKVDSTIEYFKKNNQASKMFKELSSIQLDPTDLPKDIKAFVTDTFDDGAGRELNIPSTLSKKPGVTNSINFKATKVKEFRENSRKDHL